MNNPNDISDTFIEIRSGAGGVDAMDWAQMLLKMYIAWAERQNYSYEIVDESFGEVAGLKNACLKISGEYAFGWLKFEAGVHRLIRISPFDIQKRRHTSFASVVVLPICNSNAEFKISPSDIRIDTFRASGPGGQHVNKTESAVRVVHLPTGLAATAQSKSQHQNKLSAIQILQSRLLKLENEKLEKEKSNYRLNIGENAWGSQIRTYVLHPSKNVTDHRTKVETNQPNELLEQGDLQIFLQAMLEHQDNFN
eukprot:TRINITY_DN2115_c0_g2_i1.p1 TRINITY_DN2115_c0_g2~~TRINITY_DN2115_c0_g2_i1.p1  ORF type:complete len:252 (+),score=112.62 TRINITY_DN2115_c0_g2_i1:116-871(+)